MKILIGISYYHPNISGLTIYAKRFAEEMVNRSHSVEVLTAKYRKKLPAREIIRGVLITRIWTPVCIGRGPVMPTFPIAVYKALRKSQIVNCHLPQFESFITVILAKLLKKNVILTYHCDLSGWPGLVNHISEIATWITQFIAGALADAIISYTEDYGQSIRKLAGCKGEDRICRKSIQGKRAPSFAPNPTLPQKKSWERRTADFRGAV